MKIILIILISLIIAALTYFFYLGYKSQTGKATGLVDSKLSACSKKPNCVCTEYPDDPSHFIEAIQYQSINIGNIIDAIESTGGVLTDSNNDYIAATYTSRIFKYVDDLEIRIDAEKKLLHLRSASRVGHSDMGANLKRLENFKRALEQIIDGKKLNKNNN